MMDHTNCDHPRTSGARAKCRRQNKAPWPHPPLYSLGPPPKAASVKEVDFRGSGGKSGQVPRDRDKQCDVCGVERVMLRGTPPIEQRILYVGEKCSYYLNDAPDVMAVP